MQKLDIHTIIDEAQSSLKQQLSTGERYQRQCYLERRQWQLQQFDIGYHRDWSQAQLIAELHKKLKTLRKMAIKTPWACALIIQPMVRVAYLVEVENANNRAA